MDGTSPPPGPAPAPVSRLVPLIVACALFMENLDSTIVSTVLPTIAHAFGEDPLHLSLAISAYLLSLSIFIPLSGWMADRYGARGVFRNAILIFVGGSIACAMAHGIGSLVAGRIIQGLGGAMMVPVGRLVLLRSVPKADLVGAMAFVTIPALIAPILGPPVGGLIATYASWHWIFLINVPIGALGWWLVSTYVHDVRQEQHAPLDLAGWMLLGGGVAGVIFGFENLGKHVLPGHVPLLSLAGGVALLAAYGWHVRSEPWPILRLSLMKIATFRASVGGGALFRIGVGGFTLLLPMMLQLGYGLSAVRSGMITFASAVGALAMKTIAQKVTRRFGFRPLLMFNTAVCSLALAFCGWLSPQWPWLLLVGFLVVTGFVRSLQFTCINALAFADVNERDMSQATSFSSTAQQLALSIGVGLASQFLNLSLAARHAVTLEARDFTLAFALMGALSMTALLSFRRLAPEAGNAVSGHRLAVADEHATAAGNA